MKEQLIKHINRFVPVSDQLRERLIIISELKTIDKGRFLHRPYRICNYTYFIISGLVRLYYKKKEKEITDKFSAEGDWITSVQSFMKNVPDYFYIETLEKSELIAININDLQKCFKDFPEMEKFGRIVMSTYYVEQSERIISLRFHSAKERYEYFCKMSKIKTSRLSLGMLASHLGITQETLSRIRAEK